MIILNQELIQTIGLLIQVLIITYDSINILGNYSNESPFSFDQFSTFCNLSKFDLFIFLIHGIVTQIKQTFLDFLLKTPILFIRALLIIHLVISVFHQIVMRIMIHSTQELKVPL